MALALNKPQKVDMPLDKETEIKENKADSYLILINDINFMNLSNNFYLILIICLHTVINQLFLCNTNTL